jgi:hypothetical protein
MHAEEFTQCPNCHLDITIDVMICFDCGFDVLRGSPRNTKPSAVTSINNNNNDTSSTNIVITDSPPTPRPERSIIKCEGIELKGMCQLCGKSSKILYSNIDEDNEYCETCYTILEK